MSNNGKGEIMRVIKPSKSKEIQDSKDNIKSLRIAEKEIKAMMQEIKERKKTNV